MPFFEKYQKVYGHGHVQHAQSGSSADGSMSSFSSEGRPQMHRAETSPVLARSPMSHGWPAQQADGYRQCDPSAERKEQGPQEPQMQYSEGSNSTQHKRDQSDSAESQSSSTGSSSQTSDHLLNYLDETPETSPEMPNTPVFRNLEDELSPRLNSRGKHRQSDNSSHGAEDDIIDSYPTPQAGFSARFGSLRMNSRRASANVPKGEDDDDEDRIELQIPEPEPMEPVSPLMRAFSAVKDTQATRSIAKGLPMSQSTPDSLARLAGSTDDRQASHIRQRQTSDDTRPSGITASKSLNQKRRSKTIGWTPSLGQNKAQTPMLTTPKLGLPAVNDAELGLDARLDDLLKDMNRESLVGKGTARGDASTSAAAGPPASPPKHCDSCVNVIPASRRAIKKDGQTFCKDCYTELYMPKCQKCKLTIESRAIGSGDGKIKGKVR